MTRGVFPAACDTHTQKDGGGCESKQAHDYQSVCNLLEPEAFRWGRRCSCRPAPLHPVHTVVLTLHLVCCCFIFFFLSSFLLSFFLSFSLPLSSCRAARPPALTRRPTRTTTRRRTDTPTSSPVSALSVSAAPRLSVDSQPENTASCLCAHMFSHVFCFFLFLSLTADSSPSTSTNTVAYSNHLFFSVRQGRYNNRIQCLYLSHI